MSAKQKLQKVVLSTLGHIQSTAEYYAETSDSDRSSKRRLAAVTAASLISAGLDKASDLTTDEEDNEIQPGMTPEERKLAKQNHFIDVLLEKLLISAIPNDIPDKAHFQERINDPFRKKSDNLSISKFTSNLTKLTTKIGSIFQTQFFILKIFHWTDPSLTLTCLIIYTILILHPNLFVISPLIFLLYGAMVPGYLYRHPIPNKLSNLIKVNERGDSLIEKFARVKDVKKLEEMLITDEEIKERIPEVDDETDTTSQALKSKMEFMINMRDLQNLMTALLKVSNDLENFWYGTAGFKDERVSTSLFLSVFIAVISLLLLDPFINWRIVGILIGWSFLVAIHPKVLPNLKRTYELVLKPQNKKLNKIMKESERTDIILDESPEIKQVEVFEIYSEISSWSFYLFSSSIFDLNDEFRRCQKPPPGVSSLDEVECPRTWKFHDSQWHIDYNCKSWVENRGLKLRGMYIDDNNEFLVDDQFKRRRLFRNVIRYSKPARKPPHLL
jgi:hypothetical protein